MAVSARRRLVNLNEDQWQVDLQIASPKIVCASSKTHERHEGNASMTSHRAGRHAAGTLVLPFAAITIPGFAAQSASTSRPSLQGSITL